MRTSKLVTISLLPELLEEAERLAEADVERLVDEYRVEPMHVKNGE